MFSFRIYGVIFAALLTWHAGIGNADEPADKQTKGEKKLPIEGLPQTWLQGQPVEKWEKDKVYIFEFWATWCGPCLAAMPHMEELHQSFEENPRLQLVGVNVMDRKTPEALKSFLKARPTPLTYTMAADTNGSTSKNWLVPLGVNGIPHSFAVKNGELIWRGHPSALSVPIIENMLNPGFSRTGKNKGTGSSPSEEKQTLLSVEKKLQELLSAGKREQAAALIKETEKKANWSTSQIIFLKSIPFEILARQGKISEAQTILSQLTAEYPDNYNVQMSVADDVMNSNLIPADQRNIALAEQCLQKGIQISKANKREASLPWSRLAQLKKLYGNNEEALECMEKALQLSSIGKAWEDLQTRTTHKRPFLTMLKNVSITLPPLKERANQTLGATREDALWSPLFQKLNWVHHDKTTITGIPSEKTTIINFWRGQLNNRTQTGSSSSSAVLDAVLSREALLDHPSIKIITLVINPLTEASAKQYAASPEAKTPYPLGISSDDSVAQLFTSLKLDTFPSAVVLRDGIQLWAGETKRMPGWVLKTASSPHFDKAIFEQEEASRKARSEEMKKVLTQAFALRKEKKESEFRKIMEEHASRFSYDSWYAGSIAEIRAGEAFKKKQYREAAEIFGTLLKQFPKDSNTADYIMKILSSSDELKANSYAVMRHALQIMHDANLRCDGTYNAACHEVMMKLAMEKEDYKQAEKDGENALIDLPLVREYADMLAKRQGGNKLIHTIFVR